MKCFCVNLNHTLKVSLSAKEHLVPPRVHVARRTNTVILYFVTAGTLALDLDGQRMRFSKGDVCIFEKETVQAPADCTDCEYFYIHFECDMEKAELSSDELFEKITSKNRLFAEASALDYERYQQLYALFPAFFHVEDNDLFEYLSGEFKRLKLNVLDGRMEKRLEVSLGATALLLKLERVWSNCYATHAKDGYLQSLSTVTRIADFVENNYNKPFGSRDIEKAVLLSYDHANRLFSKQMGMGIIAYRNHLRIEKAKILLLMTDKSVEEISDEIGFGDKYYFSKFFKREVGVSPLHFKRGEYFAI